MAAIRGHGVRQSVLEERRQENRCGFERSGIAADPPIVQTLQYDFPCSTRPRNAPTCSADRFHPTFFNQIISRLLYRRKFKFSVRLRYIHTCVYVCVCIHIYKGCSARERKKRKTRDGIFIERSLFAQGRCCPPLHPQSNLSIPSKGTRENYPSACLANVIDNSLRREYTDNYLFALTKVLVIVSTFLESIRLPEYRRVRGFLSRQKKNRTTPSSIFQNIVHFETPIPTRACAAIPTAFH